MKIDTDEIKLSISEICPEQHSILFSQRKNIFNLCDAYDAAMQEKENLMSALNECCGFLDTLLIPAGRQGLIKWPEGLIDWQACAEKSLNVARKAMEQK